MTTVSYRILIIFCLYLYHPQCLSSTACLEDPLNVLEVGTKLEWAESSKQSEVFIWYFCGIFVLNGCTRFWQCAFIPLLLLSSPYNVTHCILWVFLFFNIVADPRTDHGGVSGKGRANKHHAHSLPQRTEDFIASLLIGVVPTAWTSRVTTLRTEDREEKRTKGREHHLR